MSKDVIANAFGGEFPVCNEQQKVAIEEGYRKMQEFFESDEGKAYDAKPKLCACDMIAGLLNGTLSRGDLISLGLDIARTTYTKKILIHDLENLANEMQNQALMEGPALDADGRKKEWIN